MDREMQSHYENGTWDLENLPLGRKAIPCKWVFKVKTNPDGSIEKFKARLVIKGYSQRMGEDYDETFSPVANLASIRAVLSVAAKQNMTLTQFDVATAFLYGNLEEEIYMKQPEGYEDTTNKVCKLNKSLYGLKQAPRCWNKRFVDVLKSMEFKASDADPCVFIKKQENDLLILAIYVDDGLLASSSDVLKNEFIRKLVKEFKVTVKPASYFLGLEIEENSKEVIVSQKAYARKLLQRFGMDKSNPVTTPILKEDTNLKIELNKSDIPYREVVGALMYLMCGSRPDLAYAVSVVSRKLDNPNNEDYARVKRILRYIKGTLDYGIRYESTVLEIVWRHSPTLIMGVMKKLVAQPPEWFVYLQEE